MKYIATTLLTFALFYIIPFTETKELKIPVAATCNGYTPCNACSNCSQCKYCKAGGTCGACKKTNSDQEYKSKAPVSNQCKAITKKGVRCKRAADTNGYCWQHKDG